MNILYYSTEQSFYKVIVNSKKHINFRLYEMHAYNKQTNVLCGIGNYETRDRAFIVGVQLQSTQTETQGYVIGMDYASDSERIPNFILIHKKTKQKINLHQPRGSVAYAENFSYNESELFVMTKSDEMIPVKPPKLLYKPDKKTSKPIIESIDKSFVPNELRGNK